MISDAKKRTSRFSEVGHLMLRQASHLLLAKSTNHSGIIKINLRRAKAASRIHKECRRVLNQSCIHINPKENVDAVFVVRNRNQSYSPVRSPLKSFFALVPTSRLGKGIPSIEQSQKHADNRSSRAIKCSNRRCFFNNVLSKLDQQPTLTH